MATELAEVFHEPLKFSDGNEAKYRRFVLTAQTTDATKTRMYIKGDTTNGSIDLPTEGGGVFTAHITGVQDDGSIGGYVIHGAIVNDGGTTAIIGTNTAAHTSEDVAGWDAVVEADDTNDQIAVSVTGAVGDTVNWACALEMVYVTNS